LDTFSEATVKVAQSLVPASVELWKKVQAKMLPTPAKFHYQFNMRDLSKVPPPPPPHTPPHTFPFSLDL